MPHINTDRKIKTEKNETFSGAINLLQHKQTFRAF